MKVIFLDIDGVLNSNLCDENDLLEISNGEYIDEDKVKLLSAVIQKTQAVVVLHSGWRFWLNDNLQSISKEADILLSLLKKYEIEIYDKTPDFSTAEIRKAKKFSMVKASEIMAWLKEHQEVKAYLVLDDLNLHCEKLSEYQIQTDPAVGLTEEDVEQAIKMLTLS